MLYQDVGQLYTCQTSGTCANMYIKNLMLKSEEKSTQWTIVASRKVKQLTYIKGGLVSGGIHPSETFM
jgi:hypothetical protein